MSELDIGYPIKSKCEVHVAKRDPRLSGPALKVLKIFLENPRAERSGAEISRLAKISSGTLYPLLVRLEHAGWTRSRWETVDPIEVGRPRRRLYLLTALGYAKAIDALREVQLPTGELAWKF